MIKLSSFNVKNLKGNHEMVKNLIDQSNVCFLIEHWCSKEEEHLVKSLSKNHKVIFESEYSELDKIRGRPFGGMCWLIDAKYEIINYKFLSRHISMIELKISSCMQLLLVGVWMPFDDNKLETRARIGTLYSEIESLLNNADVDKIQIVLGDWNADPKRGKRCDHLLSEFCENNGLICCEYNFDQKTNYTYRNGEYIAHIDHILCNNWFLKNINNCTIIDSHKNTSDHNPILLEIDCSTLIKNNNNINNNSKNSFHKYAWNNAFFCVKYAELLDISMKNIFYKYYKCSPNEEVLNKCISELNKSLLKCARAAEKELKLDRPNKYMLKRIRSDPNHQEVYNEAKSFHSNWKLTNDTDAYNSWIKCKKDIRKMQNMESKRLKREHCSAINNMYISDRYKFWKNIANSKRSVNCMNLREIDFKAFYEKLFYIDKADNTAFQNEVEQIVREKFLSLENAIYESIVTALDVKVAIERLNKGKSTGHDYICSEFLIHGKDTALIQVITWLLDSIFRVGTMPADLNISTISPILKTGKSSQDPSDFRPISVSSTLALLFEDVVRQKISLRPHDNQFGYRPGTSTKHAYFMVNETINYYTSGGSPCWVASLDASKAFDRLWRDGLFFKLIGIIPDVIWRALYKYYKASCGMIKIDNQLTQKFKISEGVKQGGIISPFLFNFFINDLIVEIMSLNIGAKVRLINTSMFAYCDDLILISPVPEHLRKMLKVCEIFASKWRIKFNPQKSIIYCDSGGNFTTNETFKLCGEELRRTEGFIYLGLPIGGVNYVNKYWQNKFRNVEKALFSLRNIGLHKDYINPQCLGFIYKAYCQSIMIYGLELVYMGKSLRKELDIRQGIVVKSSLGLSKFSRTRPLLSALNLDCVSKLYFKYKILFLKQLNNNALAKNLFDTLKNHYSTRKKTPNFSFLKQMLECEKVVGKNLLEIDKKNLLIALDEKFCSENLGLVDSIKYVLNNYENLENSRELLRNLVRVDFGEGSLVLEGASILFDDSRTARD